MCAINKKIEDCLDTNYTRIKATIKDLKEA